MEYREETEIITVLGQRGSGKSSWVKKRLPKIPRFILWDTLGEYKGHETFDNLEDLVRYLHKNESGFFQAVYNTLNEDEFEKVCRLAGAVGTCTLIVEEVDTYATPTNCPYELRKLLKVGRHYGVSMIFVSRRPAEINRLITSQSQRFVCFKMFEPRDIVYLRSIIGNEALTLSDLPVLQYVDWRHGTIEKGVIIWESKQPTESKNQGPGKTSPQDSKKLNSALSA
jgi:hypothetical protein